MKQTSGVHNTLKKKKREKIQCPNWVEKISERYFYVEQKRKQIKGVGKVKNSSNMKQEEDTEKDEDDIKLTATEILFSMITTETHNVHNRGSSV